MAKNSTGRSNSGFSTGDSVNEVRDETVFTTTETIPANELNNLDLSGADDDMLDSAAAEPVTTSSFGTSGFGTAAMDEVRGGGAPIPPSQFGAVDTVPGSMSASSTVDTEPDLKQKAAQAVDSAKDAAAGVLDTAKEKTSEVVGLAKDKVKSQLSDQKDKAAGGLDSLTSALRQTGDVLEQNGMPAPVSDYAQSFAGQVDKFSHYLRDKDVDELARDVEDYARRNPMMFVGGAFLLGLALARFLKSSESNAVKYQTSGTNNFGTATRSTGGALVPVEGSRRGDLMSRTDEGVSRFDESALPGNPPMSAHNYVPGIGVTDGGNGNNSGTL